MGLALLAACAPRTAAPPSPVAAESPATIVSTAVATPSPAPLSLSGEWRVAGLDGADFNQSYALALSADERAIWWEPRCAGAVRGYAISGQTFRAGPDPDLPPRKPGDPTRPVCAIGLPPALPKVLAAIDTADTIRRTPQNGLLLSGGGRSVLLFSQ